MSRKYKIRDQEKVHFVTFTVINWIEVFIESVRYCQQNKGLEVGVTLVTERKTTLSVIQFFYPLIKA